VNLLDLDTPTVGEADERQGSRCRCCHRPLSAETSLGYSIGPDCRRKLGIAPRSRVRLARTKPGGDCDGQTNLLEEAS
jgi:hypothetical protein